MQPSSTENPAADEPLGAAPDEVITISRRELAALREAASGPAGRVAEAAPEPLAPARDERTAALERAYREAIRDRELATALAGRPLVPGAAAQLIKLWREDFDVFEAGGEMKVAARDGRAVAKAVAERLDEPEYAHFRPAASRGGAAVQGAGRVQGSAPAAAPRTLGEAALMHWRENASARPDPAAGPVGLRRR